MHKPALLLIDVQKGFDSPAWGQRNNPDAESNIKRLLDAWRKHDRPIIHVKHCSVSPKSPLHPDQPGNDFKDEASPLSGEPEFSKTVNSAFIGTGLEDYLREKDLNALVIVGLTTDHCVSTSTRMAGNLGFDVTLVSDATATFERTDTDGVHISAEEMHRVNLASLNGEFCVVKSTTETLELLDEK
ncbi:MAG: cysteine hydrolase [Candidatus Marinimicrobia bacterium]|jgi:nicotinamidase-related amidase|nr:cysteine hydrolase [Candidatus Neomarinimicrobiota bacterium]MBT4360333.1 cysteine hydrolase [Candidatus Neomarinimicrobiota bacterium]MBT4714550.1 cysteine hydrolase [Candidatus Neomarinimicrobiota bacterium]MBT4946589.1 cysteine hydrolase [Candidatus Neomarinimicrobiota bacterium]MBT5270332.1 cysteine hydrolase [Candidatus Neomarinimicrobiota bacterium]